MSRNIIVCSDGTGNKGGYGADTNVFKLFQSLELGETDTQVAFYDHGVGTSSNAVKRALGGAIGLGFMDNVMDGYEFLCRHYAKGDKIFLFGFSRGAATVRALAYMVQVCGLIDFNEVKDKFNSRLEEARIIYLNCQDRPDCGELETWHKNEFVTTFDNSKQHCIHFLGLWDTVSALGFPEHMGQGMGLIFNGLNYLLTKAKLIKHKYQADRAVKYVYHALAVDDNRVAFLPKVWRETDIPKDSFPIVEQVWFAGAHSNVGGGYPRSGMSDVALYWMMAWAKDKGLKFIRGKLAEAKIRANVDDQLYDPRDGMACLFRYCARDVEQLCYGPGSSNRGGKIDPGNVKIHKSVFKRMADDIKRSSNDLYGYAPGFFPFQFQLVKENSDSDGSRPPFIAEPFEASSELELKEKREALLRIEQKRKNLFFFFGWLLGFLGLFAWSFWQNPPVNFTAIPPDSQGIWHNVADILSYFVPAIFSDLIHYTIACNGWWSAGLFLVGVIMWLRRNRLSKRAAKLSTEIRELFLDKKKPGSMNPADHPRLKKRNPKDWAFWWRATTVRNLFGWGFFVIALCLLYFNFRFATTIHQPLPPKDDQVITQTSKDPFPVDVYPKKFWNRSGFYLEKGARYTIKLTPSKEPGSIWKDNNVQADAYGWLDWNTMSRLGFRLGSRLWARAPDQPLFRLMGAVDAPCRKGDKCPTQFPIPQFHAGSEQKPSLVLVSPASGELLTFANDWPFMYCNNGDEALHFTIERMVK